MIPESIEYFINSFEFLKESEFLHNVLTRQWTLSTSQTPHTQQTEVPDPNHPTFNDKLCPGGGFGPVSDSGYGISYMFPNNHRIFFHISSKKSCPNTDSSRFRDYINESLEEIRALFID
jgi:carnitine O-palmitoyltransferase 1